MKEIIILSFAAASVSFTVTETNIFNPLRKWAEKQNGLLGKMLSCGYCFGHWVALALVAAYRPKLFDLWWVLDYLLAVIVIAWLAAIQWISMCWAMNKVGK